VDLKARLGLQPGIAANFSGTFQLHRLSNLHRELLQSEVRPWDLEGKQPFAVAIYKTRTLGY
jgi:hypothetical protein